MYNEWLFNLPPKLPHLISRLFCHSIFATFLMQLKFLCYLSPKILPLKLSCENVCLNQSFKWSDLQFVIMFPSSDFLNCRLRIVPTRGHFRHWSRGLITWYVAWNVVDDNVATAQVGWRVMWRFNVFVVRTNLEKTGLVNDRFQGLCILVWL